MKNEIKIMGDENVQNPDPLFPFKGQKIISHFSIPGTEKIGVKIILNTLCDEMCQRAS